MRKKIKRYTYKSAKNPNELARKSYVIYQDFKGPGRLRTYAEESFAIILFERGTGTHTINNTAYQVKPRQIHMQFPEQKQKWKLETGAKGQRLIILKVLAETFSATLQFTFSPYNQHPVLDLDVATYKKIEAEFLAIKKELSSSAIFIELVNARCRLVALMINLWLERKFGDAIPFAANSIAYRFHSLVEKHFKTQRSVSFYARHLCITANYLGIICKKQYKMSALEFIQERVLLEAKRLLHSSDRSVKEIAFDLGFRNQSYFSYFFKSKTSLTPREYKDLLENS